MSSYLVLSKTCQEVFSRNVFHWRGRKAQKIKTSYRNPLREMKIKASLLTLPFWITGAKCSFQHVKSNNFGLTLLFHLIYLKFYVAVKHEV